MGAITVPPEAFVYVKTAVNPEAAGATQETEGVTTLRSPDAPGAPFAGSNSCHAAGDVEGGAFVLDAIAW